MTVTAATAPLPPTPPGHWLWGHLQERRTTPLQLFMRMRREHGDLVRLRMGPLYLYALYHPDHVRRVLVDEAARYIKGSSLDPLRPLAGNGLFTSEGDFWKRQRRLAQPAFHKERLAQLAGLMTDTIAQALQHWEPTARAGQPLLITQEMMQLTFQVVCRALFSTNVQQHVRTAGESFSLILETLNDRLLSPFSRMLKLERLPTARNRAFDAALARLDRLVFEIIAQRRASPQEHPDLLGLLMSARDEETGETMNDQQLRDEVMTLMLAGHETTATALSWAFHLLERHPQVQRTLEAEVDEVLGGRPPTAADFPRLRYATCIFEETLRLYPPVWITPRVASEDDVVDGYRIPKGSLIALVIYGLHRHPDFWPDPERFDPTRFLPESAKDRPRWAFAPFGAGQRMCIGNNFALMEGTFILAMAAQRFRLRGQPGVTVEPEPIATLRPRGPLPMVPTLRFTE